ncbi:unnamed protein product [Miscanthus lutarioriparius]|uniref:RNase H type-1 domain-containing protein n=1 Tax=Miscanthus lutarioriparius TaxID=422564 RepID=A0A811RUH8_9POAL|nr:unnamed protein product [Miscanthus lutarioriparius]
MVQWSVDTANDLCQISQAKKATKPGDTKKTWKTPPMGWYRCNVDAAFYSDAGQGATGTVLRGPAGSFIAGRASWYPHDIDALMMEALACRDGMILARDSGVERLQLETDCQELAVLWSRRTYKRSYLAAIFRDIEETSVNFIDFSLMYANRSCNRVAHMLAKQVTDDIRLGEWHSAPTCIDLLLTEDCNPVNE